MKYYIHVIAKINNNYMYVCQVVMNNKHVSLTLSVMLEFDLAWNMLPRPGQLQTPGLIQLAGWQCQLDQTKAAFARIPGATDCCRLAEELA